MTTHDLLSKRANEGHRDGETGESRESGAKYRGLLEAAPDAMVVVNQGGEILLLNVQAEKQFGYHRDELVGQKVTNIIPKGFAERLVADGLRSTAEALAQRIGTGIELTGRRKDGSNFPIEIMLSPLESAEGILVTAAIRDITVRKAAEKHLAETDNRRRRVEEELRQSEEQYRMLLDGIEDYAIFMMNPRGQIVSWNAGAERIKGYTADEIIGQNFSRFFPPEEIERGRPEEVLRMTAERGRHEEQGMRVRKDGSRFLASLRFTALRDPAGALRGFSELSHDLSESKESGAKYRGLLEAAPDAIVVVNQRGEIVLVNAQAEKQFGYRRDELIGQKVKNIIPAGFAERLIADALRSAEDALAQQIGTGIELTGRRKDGSDFPIELMLSPLESSEGTLVTAAIRDITRRKTAEEFLLRKVAELNRSNTELGEANKELEAFTYSVSHDLRAPLRHIDGFSKLLLEEASSGLSEIARSHLQDIRESTLYMGQLVDDLLGLARLGRKELGLQVTGLLSLADGVVMELKRANTGRVIEWKIGKLPFVECDPGLVRQVLVNLLSNAVKFTRPRETAVIEVGPTSGNGELAIFVRDNGVGFNMKSASKLFGVFQRLHRQEDFEGTGVGLATVQRIIQKHGGRVWAEAGLDRGATFFFTLGVSKQPDPTDLSHEGVVPGVTQ